MTGPDVLVISREWVDRDGPRARRFMRAYFQALDWVKANPDRALEIVQGRYVQQELDLLKRNMAKFVWHGAADQHRIMTDAGLFGQAEFVIDLLHDQLKVIPEKPRFREWVKLDILPRAE